MDKSRANILTINYHNYCNEYNQDNQEEGGEKTAGNTVKDDSVEDTLDFDVECPTKNRLVKF